MKRRGSIYIFVLMTTLLLTVVGLSTLVQTRILVRETAGQADEAAATWAARAGIEVALGRVALNANWRTAYGSGAWLNGVAIGNATVTVTVTRIADGDSDESNNAWTLVATAVCNGCTRKIETTLTDGFAPGGYRQRVD